MFGACRQASRLLSKSQDMPLTFGERLKLRYHLALCDKCREFERQLGQLRRFTRQGAQQAQSES